MHPYNHSDFDSTNLPSRLEFLPPKKKRNWFERIQNRLNLTKADFLLLAFLGLGGLYLAVKEPPLLPIILVSGLFFHCLNQIIQSVPALERIICAKIRFWHIASLILTVTWVLSLFELPAQALFLSGLEAFIKNIASQAGTAGGGQAIDENAITLVFNAIRAVFLILVGVAALFAYNQAQQGNDWRPIATQAGLAIGILLIIDVITFLFVGDGSGTGGGGTPPGLIWPFVLFR